jgi:hypothetical protein
MVRRSNWPMSLDQGQKTARHAGPAPMRAPNCAPPPRRKCHRHAATTALRIRDRKITGMDDRLRRRSADQGGLAHARTVLRRVRARGVKAPQRPRFVGLISIHAFLQCVERIADEITLNALTGSEPDTQFPFGLLKDASPTPIMTSTAFSPPRRPGVDAVFTDGAAMKMAGFCGPHQAPLGAFATAADVPDGCFRDDRGDADAIPMASVMPVNAIEQRRDRAGAIVDPGTPFTVTKADTATAVPLPGGLAPMVGAFGLSGELVRD